MLDILISYLNFIFLSLKYITRKICFRPPDPKGYRIIKNPEENIEILRKLKPKIVYQVTQFANADYIYTESKNIVNNISIPLFIFTPFIKKNRCIIYAHGNCGDIGTSVIECYLLSYKTESTVLCFEYPGYGLSKDEEITEQKVYYNIRQIYDYAINVLNFNPKNIILYGFSLGTGVVFDLACDVNYPVAGVVLQSPFLSILRTIYNLKRTPFFDIFNNCDKAKLLNAKTFFIHGNMDVIVPYIHGRILSKLIPKKYFYDFLTVKEANHNNIFNKPENRMEIFSKIKDFIDVCIPNEKIENQEKQTKFEDKDNNNNKGEYKFDNSRIVDRNSNEDLQNIKSNEESIDCFNKNKKFGKNLNNSTKYTMGNNDISEKDEDMDINIKDIDIDIKNYNTFQKKPNDLSNLVNYNTICFNKNLMTSFDDENIGIEKSGDSDNNISMLKKKREAIKNIRLDKTHFNSFSNNNQK